MESKTPSAEPRRGWKDRLRQLWRKHILPIAVIVIVLTTFRSAVADWNDVPTGSMKPSIMEGDRIFVNKLAYGLKVPFTTIHLARWDTPRRGEIVVFFSPEDGTRLVKRVVGLPGDRIELRNNRLFINGKGVEYEPLKDGSIINSLSNNERGNYSYQVEELAGHPHPVMEAQADFNPYRWFGAITVPAGHYFVMGDNRDHSRDSRFDGVGFIPEDLIVGRSSRVAMSFDYERSFMPRWDRFFKPLP
jgi:signal peptidase I